MNPLTLNDSLICKNGIKNSNFIKYINDSKNNFKISFSSTDANNSDYITLIASENKNLDLTIIPTDGKFTVNTNTILSDNKRLEVGTNTISKTTITKDYVEAPYFNATSDMRAKENITPFNGDAIKIITSLPTYTFNYKNSDTISYGILAQDYAQGQLDVTKQLGRYDRSAIDAYLKIGKAYEIDRSDLLNLIRLGRSQNGFNF